MALAQRAVGREEQGRGMMVKERGFEEYYEGDGVMWWSRTMTVEVEPAGVTRQAAREGAGRVSPLHAAMAGVGVVYVAVAGMLAARFGRTVYREGERARVSLLWPLLAGQSRAFRGEMKRALFTPPRGGEPGDTDGRSSPE